MTTTVITAQMPGRAGTRRAGRRHSLGMLAHQVRYEQLSFWRNPQSAIFTFIFPVVFIVIMGALFGGGGKSSYFGGLSALQYYVPTIAALSVLGSSPMGLPVYARIGFVEVCSPRWCAR